MHSRARTARRWNFAQFSRGFECWLAAYGHSPNKEPSTHYTQPQRPLQQAGGIMELQATAHNNDVLCSNGYYGFQPLLSGAEGGGGGEAGQAMALSNGHAGGLALAVCPARQRKRNRQEEATSGVANGTAAKVS